MRIKPPEIKTPYGLNNLVSRYTYRYDPLGGYGIFAVNTAPDARGKQVLRIESILRGLNPHQSSDAWFDKAHMVQYDHFSRIFTPEILEQWT